MTAKVSFEDALDMTGLGKFNYLMILLNLGSIMGMAFEIYSVSYLVPASACELATTNSQQGFMAGIPLIGIIATSHFWGYLADTRGRRRILSWSLILGCIAGLSATLSPNWIVFSFLKFCSSCAVAGTYALALTLLGECTPGKTRPAMIVLTASVFLLSSGIMAILTIPTLALTFSYYIPYLDIHFNSWRLLNIIYAMPCAIAALTVCFACESPKYLLTTGQEAEAIEVLRMMYTINTGKPGEDYQVYTLTLDEENAVAVKGLWASMLSQTLPLLKPPLLSKTILMSVLYVIVYLCLNPYLVWLPYIADGLMRTIQSGEEGATFCEMLQSSQNVTMSHTEDCGLNQTAMILVFCVSAILASVNTALSAFINLVGKKWMLIGVQMVSGISGLLVNVSTNWRVSGSLYIAFVFGVLNFGYLSSFSVEVFPTYVKAMAVCLTLMVGRGISVLGVNILKSMLVTNCEASFYMFAGLTVVGGLIALLLPSDIKVSKDKINSIEK